MKPDKRDANDILRKDGEDALRATLDAAAAKPYSRKANGHAKARAKKPPGLIQSSKAFVGGFTPPDYLWDGILQRGFLYSMTAATGGGKTAIALLLTACAALAREVAGRQVEGGRVLYFAGENPDDVRMRLIAMAEHMGFNIATIDVCFIPGVLALDDIEERVRAEIQELGGVALVIIDTSAAYFPGDDENDNPQMLLHARRLRTLTTLPGKPTVLALCHPTKNATPDNLVPRGGGAFLNEVDGNLTCVRNDTLATVYWHGKFRGPDFEPMQFELQTVTAAPLKDSKGRSIPTVIARALSDAEQQERAAAIHSSEDEMLMLLLAQDGERVSYARIAERLKWFTTTGKPYKSKVERTVGTLKKGKLLTIERHGPALTDKGKTAAKKAQYNRDAACGTYD